MQELKIVGVNSNLGLPMGWSYPVVEVDSTCFVFTPPNVEKFAIDRLSEFAELALMSTVLPLSYSLDESNEEDNHEIPCFSEMFSVPLYVFYRKRNVFGNLGIDATRCIPRTTKGVRLSLTEDNPDLELFLLKRSQLLSVLMATCDMLADEIVERMKLVSWGNSNAPIEPSFFAPLRLLTKTYFDLAFNQQHAIRSIAFRGLLIQKSRNSHMLSEFLQSSCLRWRLNPSLDVWMPRFESIVATFTASATYAMFHTEEVTRHAYRLIETLQPTSNIDNETTRNEIESLEQILGYAQNKLQIKKPLLKRD